MTKALAIEKDVTTRLLLIALPLFPNKQTLLAMPMLMAVKVNSYLSWTMLTSRLTREQ